MKLLSLAFAGHDHSAAFYDGTTIRYIKFERLEQVKRFKYDDIGIMASKAFEVFKTNKDEIDATVLIHNGRGFATDFVELGSNVFHMGHHYAHALSTDCVHSSKAKTHFVIDGLGDERTWSVFQNNQLIDSGDLSNGSVGRGMRQMAKLIGVKASHQGDFAGKLMSFQSYGNIDSKFLSILEQFTMRDIIKVFDLSTWVNYKGDSTLDHSSLLDWARTVNHAMHSILLKHFQKYADESDIITYSGGVAQNVVWNTTLKKHFKNLVVIPHSGDEGLSIGGLKWLMDRFNIESKFDSFPYSQSDETVDAPTIDTIKKAAQALAEGKTVGWYQGYGEVGPRALGNRSILMDPRQKYGKEKMNTIKNREMYRPFGASVLIEHKDKYFDMGWDDPFMLYTANHKTDQFPAVTHIDNSCRIQTVDSSNYSFQKLIQCFFEYTGCPVVLNTSLNVAGRPIAGSTKDAIELFNNSTLDMLVTGNKIYIKKINVIDTENI